MRHSVDPYLPFAATLFFVILRACDFFDILCFSHLSPDVLQTLSKTVILRGCDFFDFARKRAAVDVPSVPTTVLSFGSGPLFSDHLSYLSSRAKPRDLVCPSGASHAPGSHKLVILRTVTFRTTGCFQPSTRPSS